MFKIGQKVKFFKEEEGIIEGITEDNKYYVINSSELKFNVEISSNNLVPIFDNIPQPTMHSPIPMGTRVKVPDHYLIEKDKTGVVAGVSSCYVFFTYIVILDEETYSSHGKIRAICVNGTELEGLNGDNWRL